MNSQAPSNTTRQVMHCKRRITELGRYRPRGTVLDSAKAATPFVTL